MKIIKIALLSIMFLPVNVTMFLEQDNMFSLRFATIRAAFKFEHMEDFSEWIETDMLIVYRKIGNNTDFTLYNENRKRFIVFNERDFIDDDGDHVFRWEALCAETNDEVLLRLIIFKENNIVHLYIHEPDLVIVYYVNEIN